MLKSFWIITALLLLFVPSSDACKLYAEKDLREPFRIHLDGMIETWAKMRSNHTYFGVILAAPGESAESAIRRFRKLHQLEEHSVGTIRRRDREPLATSLRDNANLLIGRGTEREGTFKQFLALFNRIKRLEGTEWVLKRSSFIDNLEGSNETIVEGGAILVRRGILRYVFYYTDLHNEKVESADPLVILPWQRD